jgi:hypothetical protein
MNLIELDINTLEKLYNTDPTAFKFCNLKFWHNKFKQDGLSIKGKLSNKTTLEYIEDYKLRVILFETARLILLINEIEMARPINKSPGYILIGDELSTVIQLKNGNRYQIMNKTKQYEGSFKVAIKIILTALYNNQSITDYQDKSFLADNETRTGIIDTIKFFDL